MVAIFPLIFASENVIILDLCDIILMTQRTTLLRLLGFNTRNLNFEHKQKTYVDDLIDKIRNDLILMQYVAQYDGNANIFTKINTVQVIDTVTP